MNVNRRSWCSSVASNAAPEKMVSLVENLQAGSITNAALFTTDLHYYSEIVLSNRVEVPS